MAKTHETVRGMTDGQRSDIIATMVSAMPSLSFDQAQGIIGNKGPFVADIKKVFKRHASLPTGQAGKSVPAIQLSAKFTIGGRTYELMPFLKEGESSVKGDVMVARARELNANLGEEDGQFILEHQDEIPQEFQGKIYLVFTAWRLPNHQPNVVFLRHYFNYWSWDWTLLEHEWGGETGDLCAVFRNFIDI